MKPEQPLAFVPDAAHNGLAQALRKAVRGEVRFDAGSRALYATDASNYRQVPIGVVLPRDVQDVVATLAACRRFDAPVLARGGGTSLAGQTCNEAVVIDTTKYFNRLLNLDVQARRASVEPGCNLDVLRDAANAHGLTFGPDPSTHDRIALGGMIGNNSCGVHSVMAGRTADNVESLDILTYDGLRLRVGPTSPQDFEHIVAEGGRRAEIYRALAALAERYAPSIRARFPRIPRRVSGFALEQLLPENGFNVARALVGSEGTCVFVCAAQLRLVPRPPERVLLVLGFADIATAADHVAEILEAGPIGLEAIDDVLAANIRAKHLGEAQLERLPAGCGWLLAEFGANTAAEAEAGARQLMRRLQGAASGAAVVLDRAAQARLWELRESGLPATARVPGWKDTWEGWEDAAVPPERLGDYLRDFRALLERHGYHSSLYGHFGDGCVHVRIDFDLQSEPGIARYRHFAGEAADLVVRYGGSLSGEHGDGQSRAELLPRMYGAELVNAFREFKAIWDPQGRMNPGKVVDPYPLDSNLRLGADYRPPEHEPQFAFAGDGGSFARATLRCVGVGACRRSHGGVMCPSYMVTREEQHSTRGRARLLFEMLQGDPITDGWKSEAVREALDLCLSCKGCRRDCPMGVDMATYKAEFNAHHYAGRLRPRAAYSMGLIHRWSRVAALAPALANGVFSAPGLSRAAKWAAGVHPQRRFPSFAKETFRAWMRRHAPRHPAGSAVILFADTFVNHFDPHIAIAAVEALEAAGCRVTVPQRALCCARPLYAWGMLDTARGLLRRCIDTLGDDVALETPVIVLEPACCAAFRDELPALFPGDERAARLARNTVTLSEFLQRRSGWEPPRLEGRAVVQVHCNHHAVMGFETERALLEGTGLQIDVPDAGCCGMAGSFGFEAEHYGVSMQCAERVLLPALRREPDTTLVLADGFSCREQIAQGSDRRALHLAQLLAPGFAMP
jgi:FAD/FMN-containing dehydrogenase/Fe-S oxidoreductase